LIDVVKALGLFERHIAAGGIARGVRLARAI
jgi:hypothetical protein